MVAIDSKPGGGPTTTTAVLVANFVPMCCVAFWKCMPYTLVNVSPSCCIVYSWGMGGSDGSNQPLPATELSANTLFTIVSTTTVGRGLRRAIRCAHQHHQFDAWVSPRNENSYPPISPTPINDASIFYYASTLQRRWCQTLDTTIINSKLWGRVPFNGVGRRIIHSITLLELQI